MPKDLEDLTISIGQTATERGLIVFDGIPLLDESQVPEVYWEGDWPGFLDMASRAQATLLYVGGSRYDPEALVERHAPVEEEEDDQIETETGSSSWLRARLFAVIAPWNMHRGEVTGLTCLWLKDGIAHRWTTFAGWSLECLAAVDRVVEQANQAHHDEHVLRRKEEALKLHELATQMAHHPRFLGAKSAAKREFMAAQLFPDVTDVPMLGFTARGIAERATLIYWWEVEPGATVTKGARAMDLYARGDSIPNIAAVLKMSESNVRAALATGSGAASTERERQLPPLSTPGSSRQGLGRLPQSGEPQPRVSKRPCTEIEDLIDAVIVEMERVWRPSGFGGTFEEYAWLEAIYGIDEEDDNRWQSVLDYWKDGRPDEAAMKFLSDPEMTSYLDPANPYDVAVGAFLDDEDAVRTFLRGTLDRYRAQQVTWDERAPAERGYVIESRADGNPEAGWGATRWYWVDTVAGQRHGPFVSCLAARADRITSKTA